MQFLIPALLLALSTFTLAFPVHQNAARDAIPEPLADPVASEGMGRGYFEYMNRELHGDRPKDTTTASQWREQALQKQREREARKKAKEEEKAKKEKEKAKKPKSGTDSDSDKD